MFFLNFIFPILLIILPVMVMGLILIILSLNLLWKSHHIKSGKETRGTILTSELKEYTKKTQKVYQLKVSYEYIVDGKQYLSRRIFFGDILRADSRLVAEAQRLKYQPGTTVKVYYNPKKPKEALLEPGINNIIYWTLAFGSIFLILGLVIGSAVLFGSLDTCGITPSSNQPRPGSPAWCSRREIF